MPSMPPPASARNRLPPAHCCPILCRLLCVSPWRASVLCSLCFSGSTFCLGGLSLSMAGHPPGAEDACVCSAASALCWTRHPSHPPPPQRVPVNRLRAENICHPHQLHVQPSGRGPRQPQGRPKPRVVLNATLSWTSHLFSPRPHQSHPTNSPPLPSVWPPPAFTTQLTEHVRLPWTHKTTVSSPSSLQACLPLPSSLPPGVGLSFKNGRSPALSPLPHGRSKAGTRRAERCHAATVTRQ